MMKLELRIALECSCCKRNIDEDAQADRCFDMAFFGVRFNYGICPQCYQDVPRPWTIRYMRRWHKAMKR